VVWFSCSLGPDGLVFPSSFVQLAVAVGYRKYTPPKEQL
jgi:hypothetical protein